jgi:transglutaminase-like putative cysteine protease
MIPARRQRLRLLFRDLAAASAFLSIALSGSVPVWCLLIFGACLALSLAAVRPLSARGAVSATLLVAAALGLGFAVARQGLDLVVAATVFASLVAAQRMVSSPSPTTDQQVHLTSLLLLAGGAALSGELWYALCLGGFALFACLSMGLSVIEGPQVADEVLPVRPVLRQLGVAVALAFAGALAFFVLFPRLSWNLAQRPSGPGILGNTTGMSDRVRLGGGGDLKVSPRMVARIALEPDPSGDRLDAYWPGRIFAPFDGREWSGGGQEREPTSRVVLDKGARRGTTQQIQLLPAYGARTLIALNAPYQFSNGQALSARGSKRVGIVEVTGEEVRFRDEAQAYSYVAVSLPEAKVGAVERLEAPARFLALPESLDVRVRALADQILVGETRPERAAQRLIAWLGKNQEYSLELPGELEDPLVDFLFVRKRGHCEHFATALAVLLRTRGIPTRLVGGFYGGERIGEGWVLRGGDAHAWTQVFVEGQGWTTFDATPEAGRTAQSSRLLAWLTSAYEQLDTLWRNRVMDYSFQDQFLFVRNLIRPPVERGSERQRFELARLPGVRAWLAAAAVALVVYLAWRRLLRPRARPHPATRFLEALERRLAALGLSQEPDEPIEELSRRLARAQHPLAGPVEQATSAYLASRFAGAPLSTSTQTALLEALVQP